jgi:hypothetical protein
MGKRLEKFENGLKVGFQEAVKTLKGKPMVDAAKDVHDAVKEKNNKNELDKIKKK